MKDWQKGGCGMDHLKTRRHSIRHLDFVLAILLAGTKRAACINYSKQRELEPGNVNNFWQ